MATKPKNEGDGGRKQAVFIVHKLGNEGKQGA